MSASAFRLSRSRRRVARTQPVVARREMKVLITKSALNPNCRVLPAQTMVTKQTATPTPDCQRAAERLVCATMSEPVTGASLTSPTHATGASPPPRDGAPTLNLGGLVLTVGTPIDENSLRESGSALVMPRITANTSFGDALV